MYCSTSPPCLLEKSSSPMLYCHHLFHHVKIKYPSSIHQYYIVHNLKIGLDLFWYYSYRESSIYLLNEEKRIAKWNWRMLNKTTVWQATTIKLFTNCYQNLFISSEVARHFTVSYLYREATRMKCKQLSIAQERATFWLWSRSSRRRRTRWHGTNFKNFSA